MATKLNTPFTVTVTGSRIAITYSATYASVTFSGATATVTAHPNNTRTTAIADLGGLNAHTVLWDVCTDPVSSDRNDFIANVEALITTASASGSSGGADPTGDATLDSLTVSGATSLSGLLSSTANITAEDILANGNLEGTNLLVTGDTELLTGLTVNGGIFVTGITDVVGALSASSLSVTNGASVGGTLTTANTTTTGNHTVGGTLSTTNISASGNSTLVGSLGVTGGTTLTTLTTSDTQTVVDVNASGNVDVTGTLDVTGDTGVATLSADTLTLTHTNPSALSYFETWTNTSNIGDIDNAGGGDPDSGIFDVGKLRIMRINNFCIVNWEFRDNASPKQGFFTAGFGDTNLEPGGANIVRIPTRFAPTVFQSNRQMADSATTSLWLYMYVTPTTFVVGQHNSAGAVTNWSGSQTPAGTFCYHLD